MIGNSDSSSSRSALVRVVLTALVVAATTATLNATAPSSIRLDSRATVEGDDVRLRDVAQLAGPHAQPLGPVVVASFSDDAPLTITLSQLRSRLDAAGVNWGKISLRGYGACVVHRSAPAADPASEEASPPIANPTKELTLSTAMTLRQRVIDTLLAYWDVTENDVRISFNAKDTRTLQRSALQGRYEIEPLSASALGRVPVAIRRYRDGQLVATDRVNADVKRRHMAVVAKNAIGRHQTFTPGDLEIREVFLDTDADQLVTDLSEAVGFVASSVVRRDGVLRRQQVRSPVLVRRGELITVRCISGGLVIKTVGRAAEDGVRDQLIQVRNDISRKTYTVRVTGPQSGMATEHHADDDPAGHQTADARSHQR